MSNTWVIIAFLLVLFGSWPGVYYHGKHVANGEAATVKAEELEQAINLAEVAAQHANELAAADYAEAARAFGIALNRQKRAEASATIVEHSVATKTEYRNCSLDAEDLANLNQALGGY
ncbi:MAG: hypothetical protein OEV35_09750 [Gallionellaceae bacterium]|nr:hypothetical protein [Gallionellaceae bacterium]